MLLAHGFLKMVFDVFDKSRLRHRHGLHLARSPSPSPSTRAKRCPPSAPTSAKIADVKYEGNKALICLVGEDIRGQSGISGQVFGAISHVNIRMISQGASEINMSFMINEEDVEEAVRSLHKKFFASPDPTIFDVEARVAAMDKAKIFSALSLWIKGSS